MAGTNPRRVAIAAADPNWAGAVAAALSAAGIEVSSVTSDPSARPGLGLGAMVVAFEDDDLRVVVETASDHTAVLALGPDDMGLMLELLEVGAMGYLPSDASFDEIARGVEQLIDGYAVVPPAALGTLLRRVVDRRRARSTELESLEALTPREREVFEQAAKGRDNDGIAEALFISPATARTHLQRVFKKLDLHSRAEAVAFAARCGLDLEGD